MTHSAVSSLLITVDGLPAHPLIVHAAVVFGPLAAVGALAYLVPRWRDYLRRPVLVVTLVAFVSIWAAYLTGDNFKESNPFFQQSAQISKHEDYADVLRWVTTGFAVVAVAALVWLHERRGTLRTVAAGALGVLAVVTLVYVFLTGEAGAKSVYPPDSASAPAVSGTGPSTGFSTR